MFISNLGVDLNKFKFPASTTVLGKLFHFPIILKKKKERVFIAVAFRKFDIELIISNLITSSKFL